MRDDPVASDVVKRHNGGDELVPTMAVGDVVLSPGVRAVQHALASSGR